LPGWEVEFEQENRTENTVFSGMEMFLLRTWNNHVYSTKISFKFPNPPCQASNSGGKVSKRKQHAIHTLLRLTLKTKQKKRFYLFAMWEYEEDNCRFISLQKYVNKRFNGSDIRWKAIPQMSHTVAETTFQTIGTGLRESQYVFRISKSIICSKGF